MVEDARLNGIKFWAEPFIGGGNLIDKVPPSFKRLGSDLNPHVVAALTAIRDRLHELPSSVSEDYYRSLKGTPPEPITSWIRFVCAFGGIFESTYARQKGSDATTFPGVGKRNAENQSPLLQKVVILHGNYTMHSHLTNCLIYCDPPYQGTSGYKTGAFDHDAFYEWCRQMAKTNLVYVSEYTAPADFECVWSGVIKTNFASSRKEATHNAVEKLFKAPSDPLLWVQTENSLL
jgi:DNA adenine methylase